MHGDPALPADFAHFPYVNPDAPKGGRIDYAVQGTFNSLNPFIVQGDGARGLFDADFGVTTFDTLMMRSRDEPFTLYPLLAETVETDDERSFVEFTLDARAKFSDGKPVTPEDVIFTMELFRDKARPLYQNWIKTVDRMEKVGERGVRFTFNERADRESPLLLALLPILPRSTPPMPRTSTSRRSSPCPAPAPMWSIASSRASMSASSAGPTTGRRIFPPRSASTITTRSASTTSATRTRCSSRSRRETPTSRSRATPGDGKAATISRPRPMAGSSRTPSSAGLPSGMYGFVLNTRRDVFKDRAVRAALANLFDFEWANKNLFSGAYTRTSSYFDGSDLASTGVPPATEEKALLAPFPDAVTPEIMSGTWTPTKSDGSGRDRAFLKQGLDALTAAGYRLEGRQDARPRGQAARLSRSCSTARPARPSPPPGNGRWRGSASP